MERFTLSSYAPPTDGTTDATAAFERLFTDVQEAGGGLVTIPPGTYSLAGRDAVTLPARTRVYADSFIPFEPSMVENYDREEHRVRYTYQDGEIFLTMNGSTRKVNSGTREDGIRSVVKYRLEPLYPGY